MVIEYKLHATFPYTEKQKAWIAALASGKYQHCKGFLTQIFADGQRDCCLGVGCKIENLASAPGKHLDNTVVLYGHNYISAPLEVVYALGLRDNIGGRKDENIQKSLASINDASNSYEKVIEAICTEPDEYFTNLDGVTK